MFQEAVVESCLRGLAKGTNTTIIQVSTNGSCVGRSVRSSIMGRTIVTVPFEIWQLLPIKLAVKMRRKCVESINVGGSFAGRVHSLTDQTP